jgi:hypothetical protein
MHAALLLDYSARLHLVISDMYHKTHVVKIAEKKVLPLSVLSNTAAHITILNSTTTIRAANTDTNSISGSSNHSNPFEN